jgi:sugar porter (SP) family MFS transporter
MNRRVLIGSVATASLAGLLFGFDTAVIAGVIADLRELFQLSPLALGFTVSAALWGTLAGAVLAGIPGDRYGSRDSLRILALLYIVSGAGCALAWNWESFFFFRFVAGLAIGGSSVLAPVYITEIAPPERRGALVGLFQLNIVLGILVAYLSNYLIGGLDLGADTWRWKLGATVLPSIAFFAFLYGIPQSPRWLITKGRRDEARQTLRRMGISDSEHQVRLIEQSLAEERSDLSQSLSWRLHRKPILLAVGVALFNQLAGINAILYYANDIFAAAGFGGASGELQVVTLGATNLLFTVLALLVIDRLGRKTLLLIGAAGMAVCLSIAALVMYGRLPESQLIYVLIGFIAFFAFSQGAVIWVYISEIFPTPVRARGQSVGSSTHWALNALISMAFPVAAAWSKGAPFAFFAAMMVIQLIVVALFFPETKGVSLENMRGRLERVRAG